MLQFYIVYMCRIIFFINPYLQEGTNLNYKITKNVKPCLFSNTHHKIKGNVNPYREVLLFAPSWSVKYTNESILLSAKKYLVFLPEILSDNNYLYPLLVLHSVKLFCGLQNLAHRCGEEEVLSCFYCPDTTE